MRKISVLFCVLLMSCMPTKKEKETTGVSNKTIAENIVEKSIEHHGGIALWNRIKKIRFTKEIVLYAKNGKVESKQIQHQEFHFTRGLAGSIYWEKGNDVYAIQYENNTIYKTVNDIAIKDSIALESAKRMFFSAHYVFFQPFKLQDTGTLLKYIGTEVLDGKEHQAIEVRYVGDDEKSDIWTYFFDAKTHQLNATKVVHDKKISLIKNSTFDQRTGLLFNSTRKSFFTDAIGNIRYLRASYLYHNFAATFKD